MEALNIYQKLSAIQQEMKAPKNLFNKFGGYNYRNAESILEAFKPYENKYSVALTLDDTVCTFGEGETTRFYIMSTATLIDCESDKKVVASAMAREASVKKGMDDSQITGSTSSYARKYALNGLFLLDDTKDADSEELHNESETRAEKQVKQKVKDLNSIEKVVATLKDNGIDSEYVCGLYKVNSLNDLDAKKCDNILKHIDDIKKKQEEQK